MKQTILNRLRGMMVGLVLLAAAIPFAASTQSAASPDSGTPESRRIARPPAAENGDLNSLLRALEQTPGVSEVELDLVRRRIADLDRRRIEQMQRQDQQGDAAKSAPGRTGATDGEAHPGYPVTRPVIEPPFDLTNGARVEVKGMVDRKAGFRIEDARLLYQNYASDPEKPSGSDPVLFDGKFAYDVTVNGKAWQ